MKEARELQTFTDQLHSHIKLQDNEIDRLKLKIRAALAALQTGKAIDVVAAIEILRKT